jgi:hypothetical protein
MYSSSEATMLMMEWTERDRVEMAGSHTLVTNVVDASR